MRWNQSTLVKPVIKEFPFFVLFAFALAMGALADMFHICDIEDLTPRYVFGLTCRFLGGIAVALTLAYGASCIIAATRRRWIKYAFYTIATIALGTFLFIWFNFGTRLTPEILNIVFETDLNETTEFWATFGTSPGTMVALAGMLGYIATIRIAERRWAQRQHHAFTSKTRNILASCAIVACIGYAVVFWLIAMPFLHGSKQRSALNFGCDAVSNTILATYGVKQVGDNTQDAIIATQEAMRSHPICNDQDSLTVVLVIGESYIKHHAQVYGYPLGTTPRLAQEQRHGNLFVFNDMVSPYTFTSLTLRNVFSLNSMAMNEQWYEKPLFTAIFKQAGFYVTMWDNQRQYMQHTPFQANLNSFIYNKGIIDLCYNRMNAKCFDYDAELIQDYKKSSTAPHKHNLAIFHLKGQHFDARERYPKTKQFQVFSVKDYTADNRQYMTDKKRQVIADYDNATLYNDYVLGLILDLFRNSNAVMLYLSDHGEEVYDYRDSRGRKKPKGDIRNYVKYQNEVPFMIWCSNKFKQSHPELTNDIEQSLNRPAMIDAVGHSLLHLAGISTRFYVPENDILNARFTPRKRIVNENINYDEVMNSKQ